MINLNAIFICILFTNISISSFCQDNYRVKLCQEAINRRQLNKVNTRTKFYEEYGKVKYEIRYLGETTQGYRITTIAVFSGIGKHAVSEVYVFNKANKYIGRYRGFLYTDLPNFLKDDKLFFINNKKTGCKKSDFTQVDFSNSIPKSITIFCNGDDDVIYFFFRKN